MPELTKIQEARIILGFIKASDKDGSVTFPNHDLGVLLSKLISNGNHLDHYLYELNEGGVLHYEEIGEDGFAPIIMCNVSVRTHEYLEELLLQVNQDVDSLRIRIKEILTFDPTQMAKEIRETEQKLGEVKESIASNDLLKPLENPISEISKHFNSAKVVSESYEEIYKNIVRPMQEEGRQGVKVTVRWAVISIIVSVALSWLISNWTTVLTLIKNT